MMNDPLLAPGDEVVDRLRGGLGVTQTFAEVLVTRGHSEVHLTRGFLDPRLADLTPP